MGSPVEVYGLRLELDRSKQPSHSSVLERLAQHLIKGNPASESVPYTLSGTARKRLATKVKGYRPGTPGARGLTDSEYLYRLQSMASLFAHHKSKSGRDARDEHEYQTKRWRAEGRPWLPLRLLIDEPLVGYGGVTWWTPIDLSKCARIEEAALQIGIAVNWIHSDSIILRCPSSGLLESQELRVPTVLDGFEFPIFLATLECTATCCGVAVDLRGPSQPRAGTPEFVVRQLDVAPIQFMPIAIDTVASAAYGSEYRLRDGSPLWRRLADFYFNELAETAQP